MSEKLYELGVVGLTTLGESLAVHHASNGIRVCVGDEDPSLVPRVVEEYRSRMDADEDEGETQKAWLSSDEVTSELSGCLIACDIMGELSARLSRPRKIIVFGTHSDDRKFENVWNSLGPHLEAGDAVLRWGKEGEGNDKIVQFYNHSIVGNLSRLQARPGGIHLLEMVRLDRDRTVEAEAEWGDHHTGACLLGGPREGYELLESLVSPFVAVGHAGNDAACAHYARMLQRAIENGAAQAVAEGAGVLTRAAGHGKPDAGKALEKWIDEGGRMSSYLLRATSEILCAERDEIAEGGDSVEMEAVDAWASLEATRLGTPAPTVSAVLGARFLSSMGEERAEAASVLKVPEIDDTTRVCRKPRVMKDQICDDLQGAMYCACLCVWSECLSIFLAASEAESWDANVGECVRLWNRPGSFLESALLAKIHASLAALENGGGVLKNLLVLPDISSELQELHMAWRRIVALSFASAVPVPLLSSSLTFYDSYRSRRLPIGLIKAQRDYFDASGYDRSDQDGNFTTCWIKEHTRETTRVRLKEAREEAWEAKVEAALAAGEEPPKRRRRRRRAITGELILDDP